MSLLTDLVGNWQSGNLIVVGGSHSPSHLSRIVHEVCGANLGMALFTKSKASYKSKFVFTLELEDQFPAENLRQLCLEAKGLGAEVIIVDDQSCIKMPSNAVVRDRSAVSMKLKAIAKDLGLIVILGVCIPNSKDDDYPRVCHLSKIGYFEADGDQVIFSKLNKADQTYSYLLFKNRSGACYYEL